MMLCQIQEPREVKEAPRHGRPDQGAHGRGGRRVSGSGGWCPAHGGGGGKWGTGSATEVSGR